MLAWTRTRPETRDDTEGKARASGGRVRVVIAKQKQEEERARERPAGSKRESRAVGGDQFSSVLAPAIDWAGSRPCTFILVRLAMISLCRQDRAQTLLV